MPTKKQVVKARGSQCFYCKEPLEYEQVTIDHVIPRSRGGSGRMENLVPCCRPCNVSKGRALLGEWVSRAEKNAQRAKKSALIQKDREAKNAERKAIRRNKEASKATRSRPHLFWEVGA